MKSFQVSQPHLPVSADENDDGDNGQVVPTRRRKSKLRAPGISSQRGRLRLKDGAVEGLKRLLEGSEARKEARDGKRIQVDEERTKLEADAQVHCIESERLLQRGLPRFGLALVGSWLQFGLVVMSGWSR